jgi:hypothetical protein
MTSKLDSLIKASPEPKFDYETNLIDKTLIIKSDHLSERLSTILGSRGSESLIICLDDIHRIPHDLVHIAIWPEPERTLPGSLLTPDIQLEDGTVIEISTRATHHTKSLETAIIEKVSKYSGLVQELIVVAVNFNFCLCTHDLSQDSKSKLIRYYKYGVKMMKSLLVPLGLGYTDPTILAGIGKCPPAVRNDIFSLPSLVDIKVKSSKPTWDSYLAGFDKEEARIKNTVVHVPMIQFLEDDLKGLHFSGSSWRDQLIEQILSLKPQHVESIDRLEKKEVRRFMRRAFGKKKPDEYPDQITLALKKEDKLEMALRGVRSKRFRFDPLIVDNRKRHKLPISQLSETSQIDSFVDRSVSDRLQPSKQSYDDRIAPLDCDMIECLENYEHMIREVAMNATRRCHSNQFIIRKLLNKPCYVIMCNTSYSSPHDKPSFYCVIAKGLPYESDVFGSWISLENDWHYYDFVSTDRRRMEHLIGLPEQVLALRVMLEEQLGDLNPNHTWKDLTKTWKVMILILLSDNNNLSLTLQSLRYYYMELYSGSKPKESLKIISKMPETCRCLMQLWIVKKLAEHHPVCRLSNIVDFEDDEEGLTGTSLDTLHPINTPFGFQITSLNTMLLASYMCMLKNKDEQNIGHDSKTIFKKTLKREYEYQDRIRKSDNKEAIIEHKTAGDYKTFEASGQAISFGANLVKKKIMKNSSEEDWDGCFRKLLWSRIHKETINSLFSTKSSSTVNVDKVDPELCEYDKRSKVFLRLLEEQSKFSEELLFGCYDDWIDKVVTNVSMFKKNQIGGVREIYILNFYFRVAVKYVEDISRAICMGHPSEALTKSHLKEEFVVKHFDECRINMHQSSDSLTLRVSSDMTHWANLMMTDYFRVMFSSLLPRKLYERVDKILTLHDNKKLYMPKALIESFYKTTNPESYVNDELNRLRKEFLGMNEPIVCAKDQPWVSCRTNMMQGILHYTSSLYHLCHLEVLSAKLKSLSDEKKLKSINSFIVSSDDESILWTLADSNKITLSARSKDLFGSFKSIKTNIDLMFGVRTSWEKSTYTVREIIEFNSVFKVRNTTGSPLIKFVCRSVDDNIAETLNSRVRSMYQQLRTIRENGGSGSLCSIISTLQSRHIRRNLGESVVGWFENCGYDVSPKFSFLGKIVDSGPALSGLTTIDYQNWLVCRANPANLSLYAKYGFSVYVDSDDKEHSLSYRMFPRDKFIKALRSVGLTQAIDLSSEDVRIVMSRTRSVEDMRRLNEIRSCSPGIAASFCFLARTDNVRASAYLLTAPLFQNKSFRQFALEKVERCEFSLPEFFPDHFEHMMMHDISTSKFAFIKSKFPKSKRFKYYFPSIDQHEHKKNITKVLSKHWFKDERTGLNEITFNRLLNKIKSEFKWISDTCSESLANSPFPNYYSMLSFLESVSKKSRPWRLLSVSGTGRQSLLEVYTSNTYPNHTTVVEHEPVYKKTYDWMVLENRVSAWSSLLLSEENPHESVIHDIINCSFQVSDEVLRDAISTAKRDSRKLAKFVFLMRQEEPILDQYVDLMDDGELIWVNQQHFNAEESVYEGRGVMVTKFLHEPMRVLINSHEIIQVESCLPSPVAFSKLRDLGFLITGRTKYLNMRPMCLEPVLLGYASGVRLLIENGTDHPGVTSRVFGCRHSIMSSVKFSSDDPIDPVIDSYLNNVVLEHNAMRCYAESKSPLKERLAQAIRFVRSGTRIVRLSERNVPEEVFMGNIEEEQSGSDSELGEIADIIQEIGQAFEDEFDPDDFVDEIETVEQTIERERDHIQLISGRMLYIMASAVNQLVKLGAKFDTMRDFLTEQELARMKRPLQISTTNISSRIKNLMRRFRR